jgi:hypothetical protein
MLAVPSPRCSSLRHFAHGKPSRTIPIKCISCTLLLFAFTGRPLTAQVVPSGLDANGIGSAGPNDSRVRMIRGSGNYRSCPTNLIKDT